MFEVVHTVFVRPLYAYIALVVAWLVFSVAVWLPNTALILLIFSSSQTVFIDKIQFLLSLYGSIGTNFTVFSATYTILIAILFGMNVALFIYYVRKQQSFGSGARPVVGTGIGGLVSGFLGIGCAACGTFILTSLLSVFGASVVLTYLPLDGEEFGILGVILLGYSLYVVVRKIQAPNVCVM